MIFVLLSVITYSIQNMSNKELGRRYGSLKGAVVFQDTFLVFFATVIMLCTGSFAVPAPKYILLSALFGLLYIIVMFSIITAMKYGPVGDTTIMVNLGLFFSSIFGVIKYHDPVTLIMGIGIACMFAVIMLSIPSKSERKESPNRLKWFIFAFLAAALNGCLAIIKRIVAGLNMSGGTETIEMKNFLIWAFGVSTICGLFVILITRAPKETFKTVYLGKKGWLSLIFVILCGMGSACGNLFQMVAISKGVSSAVVYPVCAGLLITIAWLISVLYYKETKVTAKSLISLFLCVAGIVFAQL